jgi:hypothetical protein
MDSNFRSRERFNNMSFELPSRLISSIAFPALSAPSIVYGAIVAKILLPIRRDIRVPSRAAAT